MLVFFEDYKEASEEMRETLLGWVRYVLGK